MEIRILKAVKRNMTPHLSKSTSLNCLEDVLTPNAWPGVVLLPSHLQPSPTLSKDRVQHCECTPGIYEIIFFLPNIYWHLQGSTNVKISNLKKSILKISDLSRLKHLSSSVHFLVRTSAIDTAIVFGPTTNMMITDFIRRTFIVVSALIKKWLFKKMLTTQKECLQDIQWYHEIGLKLVDVLCHDFTTTCWTQRHWQYGSKRPKRCRCISTWSWGQPFGTWPIGRKRRTAGQKWSNS